ncbi:hypothetical protein ALC53_09537 [Atta colombica]|uniref:Uncharacterized protein n=1 Tax=Atta colombica TaxID=520822 RepID=A0A195B677_9HYME|nr:hypothetical protein ALC53_09537 [Atta colombica]
MTGDYFVRVCAIAVGGAASRSLHLCKRASGAMEQRMRTIDRSFFLRARSFVLIGNDNREIQGVLGGTPGPRTGAEDPLVDPARASGNAGAVETQKHGRRSFDGMMGYRRRGSPTVIHTAVLLRPPGGATVVGFVRERACRRSRVLIVEEERAKEPPIEHPLGIFFSHSRSCCTVPLVRPTELNRIGGDGGRNEEATGSGAGQSVGQPVGLSFPARFARSAFLVLCSDFYRCSNKDSDQYLVLLYRTPLMQQMRQS